MKTQQSIGSEKFWKTIAIMLGIFVFVSAVVLICWRYYDAKSPVTHVQQNNNVMQNEEVDHSFEATSDRVNSINENYGESVKASYYGQSSTMENLAQQRVFFSNLKTLLVIILILLVILLILVKGFGLFKKKESVGNAGDASKGVEEPKQKPVKPIAKPQGSAPVKKNPPTEEKDAMQTESHDEEHSQGDADDKEVADNCQLP